MTSMWKKHQPRFCVIFSLCIYMEYTPPFLQQPSKIRIVPYICSHFPLHSFRISDGKIHTFPYSFVYLCKTKLSQPSNISCTVVFNACISSKKERDSSRRPLACLAFSQIVFITANIRADASNLRSSASCTFACGNSHGYLHAPTRPFLFVLDVCIIVTLLPFVLSLPWSMWPWRYPSAPLRG